MVPYGNLNRWGGRLRPGIFQSDRGITVRPGGDDRDFHPGEFLDEIEIGARLRRQPAEVAHAEGGLAPTFEAAIDRAQLSLIGSARRKKVDHLAIEFITDACPDLLEAVQHV